MRMKRTSIILFALLVMIAVGSAAQMLPVPHTEPIFPGTKTVYYAGNAFTFTTTVKLSARFEWFSPNIIQIRVRTHVGSMGTDSPTQQVLRIYWEEGDEVVYDDVPPSGEWTGLVLTEGGLTEK
jgi:hypothetical protein